MEKTTINIESLDKVETIDFSFSNKLKTIYIVGGIHGDEIQGVKGAELLKSYFQKNNEFSQKLRSLINIKVIPILNKIGYLAGLRCSPTEGLEIKFTSEGKIKVEESEVFDVTSFSMKILRKNPEGWTDPNRGWDSNKTLVKKHLLKIIESSPDYIFFHHDWSDVHPYLNYYGDDGFDEKLIALIGIIQKFSDKKIKNSKSNKNINLIGKYNEMNDSITTSYEILKLFKISNFVFETYAYEDSSSVIHFCVVLFVIAKLCNLEFSDEELIEIIFKESQLLDL